MRVRCWHSRSRNRSRRVLVGDLKADELNRSGFAALQAGNYAEAITLLKRVVELEPKDKTAWNNLGRSYTALRQYDPAIEAFRKQIEINPYDQYSVRQHGARIRRTTEVCRS